MAASAFDPATAFLGRFESLRKIGAGGMAVVYRARDVFRDRDVAIKVVQRHGDEHDTQARLHKLWINETRLAGRLQHPHIVEVLEAGSTDDVPFLVMEHLAGGTLKPHTSPERLLPIERVADIVFKMGSALAYSTTQGLLHRDVKPANILLDESGTPKLSDFGSCYIFDTEETQIQDVGTLPFMPPEQFGGAEPSAQTDIYALGVVAYQLLVGGYPFLGDTPTVMIYQKVHGEPPAIETLRPDVPAALREVVHCALHRDPRERFPEWKGFLQALATALPHLRVPASELPESARFERLRRIAFFRAFKDAELWEAVRIARFRELAAGEMLFAEGAHEASVHVIESGELAVERGTTELNRIGAGECIGEIAYLDERVRARTATVRATTATAVATFDAQALKQSSLRLQAMFARTFMQVLLERQRRADERYLALARRFELAGRPLA